MIARTARVLAGLGLLLGLVASVQAADAALPAGVRLAGHTTVTASSGSSVVGAVLDRPVTIPAWGLNVTSWSLSNTTWAAVVIARQPIPGRVPVAPYFVGSAYVSAGGSARTTLPMFGQSPVGPAGTGLQLPAGGYAVYVLTAPGGSATAGISIPGLTGSVALHGRSWVDSHMSTVSATAGVDAASAGTTAESVRSESAIALFAATSGDPVAHDLALCVVKGPATPGVPGMEDACGTPAQSSVASSRSTGALGGAATAIAPVVPRGSYATAFHLRVVGPGSAAAVTVLRWTWTTVWDALLDCRARDLTARTTTPRTSYRSGEAVLPRLALTNRSSFACAMPATCPPAALDIRDSGGRAVGYPRPAYGCPAMLTRTALQPGASFTVLADEWDTEHARGRYMISARWWLLGSEQTVGKPVAVTIR